MPSQELMQAVLALINADDDLRQKRVISEHANLLLTDDANQLLADWFSQSKSNASYSRVLQERLAKLARYREASKRVAQEPKPSSHSSVQPSPELIEAVLAFVNADSDAERKGLVLARGDLLLSDAADELLADWVSQSKGNAEYTRVLQECRTLLAHYRHEATSHKPPSPPREKVRQAVREFVDAKEWGKRKQIVESQRDYLLTDAADHFLADWIEQEEDIDDESEIFRDLQACREVLAGCRRDPIKVAFASRLRPIEPLTLMKAVQALISTKSWAECKRLVEAKQDFLLSEAADQLLADFPELIGDEDFGLFSEEYRKLLARCRSEGIEAAFADYLHPPTLELLAHLTLAREEEQMQLLAKHPELFGLFQRAAQSDPVSGPIPDELDALVIELLRLPHSSYMPRREKMCRAALAQVDRDDQLLLWAWFHAELGKSLSENRLSTQAESQEQAIYHLKQALSVYTRQAFPEKWGDVQHDLGDAYREHIHGERAENLEQAISFYQQAQKVYARQAFPEKWADIQNKLGIVYSNRIRGERGGNIEQAIDYYKQALQVWTRQAFPKKWAITQNNLGEAYRKRIRGVKADNLEQAIHHFQQALHVRTRQAAPVDWAMTQQNLALAYSERIRGTRAENLEQAIDHFKQALKVRTRQALPEKWATTQQNLALAYLQRIRGVKADNLEQAINCFKQALEVIERQGRPELWANIQNNLALAYRNRIRDERADNLEKCIHHSQQALQVYTYDAFAFHWAMSQANLASFYVYRIRGERAKNYEQAIYHSQQALRVITHETFPSEWAVIQDNLANIYAERIRGERALNLEQAIDHSQQALLVYTRQDFPELWAKTHNNLAGNYAERIRGERADNLEQAIYHFEQTLEVCTRQAFPEQWAVTMTNLGNLYAKRIHGEEAENVERAIDYLKLGLQVTTRQDFPYEWARAQNTLAMAYLNPIRGEPTDNIEPGVFHAKQALLVYTRQAFPIEWAMIQSNLAVAYWLRIHGQRADNIKEAVHHAQQALQIYTPSTLPQRCRGTALVLGGLLYEQKRFSEAREALVTAHQAVDELRGEVTREMGKRILSGDNAILYGLLVDCCLREEDEKAAFEYAVAGKGRAFVDMLASTRFDISKSGANDPQLAADWQKIRELRSLIDQLLTLPTGHRFLLQNVEQTVQKEALLRYLQEQEAQRWEELTYKYPTLTVTQSAPQLSVPQAQALATELDATLVEFVQHAGGWSAFVVTTQAVRHVPLDEMNQEFWQDMMDDWLDKIEDLAFHNEPSYLALDEWYDVLIAPLNLPPTGKIVLAPAGNLHLIPLSIARNPETLAYLCDDYQITFTPSLAALRISHLEAKKAHQSTSGPLQTLLSAAYAGMPEWQTHPDKKVRDQYLDHAIPEVKAIAAHFPSVTSLHDNQATPGAVIGCAKGQDVIHFSCHGSFDSERPEQSGLVLSDGWLTIQRIITELRLTQTRLVTLSACQTHRIRANAGEEHTGLVQAFMSAGAKCVVASLWKVPEEPTRVLFQQFYRAVAAGEPPASALQKAMQVVRQEKDSDGESWEHPYYWAAFQVSGLGYNLER